MNWFLSLVFGSGIAHTAFVYALVIALGMCLGKIKIFGISLGAAQEALHQLSLNEPVALGYAVAYPLGVVGAIFRFANRI